MTAYLLTAGRLLSPDCESLLDGYEVLIEDGIIREVSDNPITSASATRVDLGGRTLMPGLIDCHVHVVSNTVDIESNALMPSSLVAMRAARIMNAMLLRGFTAVRDCAGADIGLVMAVEEGLIDGPRLVICGKGLTMTGGHVDLRRRQDTRPPISSDQLGMMGVLCDGVPEVQLVTRAQLKAGAHFIKIMANGGVASPTDPIHSLQYSRDEILAIVEEASNAGSYVSAHVYTDASIRRVVECGVLSLEHCNLIGAETARLAAEKGCIAVPTLAAFEGLALEGPRFGLSKEAQAKLETVRIGGQNSLAIMRDAGLPMAFGTDLLGELKKYHCMEFELLNRVLTPGEILRSATTIGARLCKMEGQIGTIAPGAFADLLVVDGDPTKDISVLADDGAHMAAIIAAGRFAKRASL